jgi:putative transposon-encoded protein
MANTTTKAGTLSGKFKGTLALEEIEVSEVYTKKVLYNNQSSAKVHLPKKYVNKTVYVVVPNSDK